MKIDIKAHSYDDDHNLYSFTLTKEIKSFHGIYDMMVFTDRDNISYCYYFHDDRHIIDEVEERDLIDIKAIMLGKALILTKERDLIYIDMIHNKKELIEKNILLFKITQFADNLVDIVRMDGTIFSKKFD